MTRQDIEREFTVKDGAIVGSDKFDGEPIFAPYFWDKGLRGEADAETDFGELQFAITDEDRQLFPELGKVKTVTLAELDNGFVITTTTE